MLTGADKCSCSSLWLERIVRELDVYHTKHEGKEGVSPLKNQKTGGFRESRFSQQCGGAGQRPDAKKLDDDDDVSSRNDDDETNSAGSGGGKSQKCK